MKSRLKNQSRVVNRKSSLNKISKYGVFTFAMLLALLGTGMGSVHAATKAALSEGPRVTLAHEAAQSQVTAMLNNLVKNDSAIKKDRPSAINHLKQEEVIAPEFNDVWEGDTVISGTGEPEAQINVFMDNPDGGPDIFIGKTTVNVNGIWKVNASHYNLREGDVLFAYQGEGTQIKGAQTTVKSKQADVPQPVVDSVKRGARNITGKGVANDIITAYLKEPGGSKQFLGAAPVNVFGNWKIAVPDSMDLQAGNTIEVVQATSAGARSTPIEITVTE